MTGHPNEQARETFTFARWVWDITAARAIVAGRPHQLIAVGPLHSYLAIGLIRVDADHAMSTDLTQPLILAPLPGAGGNLPIDGWHRIYHALRKQVEYLPAVALTDAEGDQIRTQIPGWHPLARPAPAAAVPRPADQIRANTPSGRLPDGAVRDLVAAHLDSHPGQGFTIGELARVLGIAKAPVRDAVRHLVADHRAIRTATRHAVRYTSASGPATAL
ncbi:hypothetical protein [Phytohabitans rumicis]|uniref:HTH iclR-type domain-containing protein n=1 Tax=Phytohabitans rumicis TaxID=1076125 RepID=A0A6V8LES1_9ACTN|nr:hypothetical protein [Phytohabitans rumicis]GFJ93321.1 hypothetical protein Prum_069630 [Phytohabitans rumicis]